MEKIQLAPFSILIMEASQTQPSNPGLEKLLSALDGTLNAADRSKLSDEMLASAHEICNAVYNFVLQKKSPKLSELNALPAVLGKGLKFTESNTSAKRGFYLNLAKVKMGEKGRDGFLTLAYIPKGAMATPHLHPQKKDGVPSEINFGELRSTISGQGKFVTDDGTVGSNNAVDEVFRAGFGSRDLYLPQEQDEGWLVVYFTPGKIKSFEESFGPISNLLAARGDMEVDENSDKIRAQAKTIKLLMDSVRQKLSGAVGEDPMLFDAEWPVLRNLYAAMCDLEDFPIKDDARKETARLVLESIELRLAA